MRLAGSFCVSGTNKILRRQITLGRALFKVDFISIIIIIPRQEEFYYTKQQLEEARSGVKKPSEQKLLAPD